MGEVQDNPTFKKEEVKFFLNDTDLAQAARFHLDFLKEIDSIRALRDLKVIKNALYRYEKLWLPLAASHRDEVLMPPIDVHWCWHSHLLAPVIYKRDCLKQVGCEINHRLVSVEERAFLRNKTQALWADSYPDELFNLDLTKTDVPEREGFESELEYDVKAATTRQKTFYYNVSLPHHRNEGFLQRGIARYRQFVFLIKSKKGFIVPYYDQDLIWHTHQLFPQKYAEDTLAFLGRVLHHDDTDGGDRSPEAKLVVAGTATRALWKDIFKEAQNQPGCGYRGGIRHHDLHPITADDLSTFNLGPDVVFSVEGPSLDDFRKKLVEAMTAADTADFTFQCGDGSIACKVQFNRDRNVFFTMSVNDKPVILGRNISNYEVPLPIQVSDGPDSGVVMISKTGDIGMVIVDAIGDWSVSKIHKVAAIWPGKISTWYRGTDAVMITEADDRERSKYTFDLPKREVTVSYGELLIHRLASAVVDLVLREWPEIGKKPLARVIAEGANNCALL